MITAGIDIGTEVTKVVILSDDKIAAWHVSSEGNEDTAKSVEKVLYQAVAKAGLHLEKVQKIAVTGLYDIQMPFMYAQVSETKCIAMGVDWLLPSTRIALDLGVWKSLVLKCQHGIPIKVARNDKCASGTGKYLDIVASILGTGIEEMADLSLRSGENVAVESTCAVFAESEVISLLHMKHRREDIARGAMRGLAKRIYPLLLEVGLEKDVSVVGGLARNKGLVMAIEELVGYNVLVPPEPQIVAALGAALILQDRTNF
jgi:predicted CoA-substrate-specific enzyme activase